MPTGQYKRKLKKIKPSHHMVFILSLDDMKLLKDLVVKGPFISYVEAMRVGIRRLHNTTFDTVAHPTPSEPIVLSPATISEAPQAPAPLTAAGEKHCPAWRAARPEENNLSDVEIK
jgi:hypothetical protein